MPDKPLPYGELLSSELLNAIIAKIACELCPEKVIIFGSYARGTPGPDSDLDILIVMNSELPRHKRVLNVRALFNPQPCPMDILVYTPQEVQYWNGTINHIITEAFETGIVHYERKAA
jgi:predicted nucleotidyltransferase